MNANYYEIIKEALKSYTDKITSSPEEARKALVAEGIYKENGELHENYIIDDDFKPTIPEAYADAQLFRSFLPGDIDQPRDCPEMDGTFCLYWKDKSVYLVTRFRGFGTFAYYGKSRVADERIGGSECQITEEEVNKVADFVKRCQTMESNNERR